MSENLIKIYVKNIPDNIPDDKFLDVLKKTFENSISGINIYKHQHKFKQKINKLCHFFVPSQEVKEKVYEFFSTFDMIDQRGMKHKLKVCDSIYNPVRSRARPDPLNNTISESKIGLT